MNPRLRLVVGVGSGLTACGLSAAAPFMAHRQIPWLDVTIHVGVAVSFIAAGLIAWARRPDNRTGPLMMLVGYLWLSSDLRFIPLDWPWTIAAFTDALYQPMLGYVALAYPTGRLQGRGERLVVALAFAWTFANNSLRALLDNFDGCSCGRDNPLYVGEHPHLLRVLDDVSGLVSPALILLLVVFIGRRWRASTVKARRVMAPVLWAVVPAAGFLVAREVGSAVGVTGQAARLLFNILPIGLVAFPIGLLIGLLRTRLSYVGVARLVRNLAGPLAPGDVQRSLADALHDPTLRVYYWSASAGSYLDDDGTPTDPLAATDRLIRPIQSKRGPIAAMLGDPALAEEGGLVDAVIAAAQLALENESLQAEVRAQLSQLRGAATRIVDASEQERRRIERDLHDGAQQRLLALSLSLASARQHMDTQADAEILAVLTGAGGQLQAAITELRELARGIHPVLLTQEGLAVALQALADRATIPAEVVCIAQRFPERVEATTYYIAAEALTNAMRHAHATHVRVDVEVEDGRLLITVEDDGIGGADTVAGSGLRGLADRAAAIGGNLTVRSTTGSGTTIIASLPCA